MGETYHQWEEEFWEVIVLRDLHVIKANYTPVCCYIRYQKGRYNWGTFAEAPGS